VFLTSALDTDLQTKSWAKSIFAGGLGLSAALIYDVYDDQWPWFAAALSGMVLAPVFASGAKFKKLIFTGMIAGCAIFCGLYVTQTMASNHVLAGVMPGTLAQMVYGSILGFFLGLGSSAQHLQRKTKTLRGKVLAAIKEITSPELRNLLERTNKLYDLIKSEFSKMESKPHSEIEQQVDALSSRILKLTEQCTSLENDLAQAEVEELTQRISDLKIKLEKSNDPAAKRTFNKAVDNLEEQHQVMATIKTSYDRVLARIHADVALLERLRFALLQLRSTSLQKNDEHGVELNLSLEALSQEIEATCHVVDEVYSQPYETNSQTTKDTEKECIQDTVSPETMMFRKTG